MSSIQKVTLKEFPKVINAELKRHDDLMQEGDTVRISKTGGHRTRVLKDILKSHRKTHRRIAEDEEDPKKKKKWLGKFPRSSKKEIKREYHLIVNNPGVIVGRSPLYGLPTSTISNVCYLIGGSGFSGIDYEYDVCFVKIEKEKRDGRTIKNRVCLIHTCWGGALEKTNDDVKGSDGKKATRFELMDVE